MSKTQKVTAVISLIVVLVLAVTLGLFLWMEERRNDGSGDTGGSLKAEQGIKEDAQGEDEIKAQNPFGAEDDNIHGLSGEEPKTYEEEQAMQEDPQPEISDISMVFTGDVLLGNSVINKYNDGGINGILSEYLQTELTEADITMINEEFPFSSRGTPMPDKQYTFRADKSYVRVFEEMGVDVVSLANNHAMDYGTEALLDTFDALDETGIPYAGAGTDKERAEEAIFLERGQRTVGILSASRVIPVVDWNIENRQPGMLCTYDSAALKAAIERTRPQCDYLVVYVHWGVEYQAHPEEYQRTLAQTYIDAGADLVVGSHPHVPQGIEYYRGKPIVYSLGNFIFSAAGPRTYALKVVWDGEGESRLKVLPVETADTFTYGLEDDAALEMYDYIEKISFGVSIDENGMVTPQ